MLEILCLVRDRTRMCPGCLGSWLDDGGYLRGPITYAEQWESEEALRQHLASDVYAEVLVAMELSTQQPEILFCFVSTVKGMELIQETRGQRGIEPVNRN